MAVKIKGVDAYQKELKNDYIINKELSGLAGSLALKCGRFLAVSNAELITTKRRLSNLHQKLSNTQQLLCSRRRTREFF